MLEIKNRKVQGRMALLKNGIGFPIAIGLDRVMLVLNIKDNLIKISNEKIRGKGVKYTMADEGAEIVLSDTGEIVTINKLQGTIRGIGNDDTEIIVIDYGGKKGEDNLYITLNLPRLVYQTNEPNLSDKKIISEMPRMIKQGLINIGLDVPIEDCNVSSIEINYNMYGEFYKAFEVINNAWKLYGYKHFKTEAKKIESLCLKMSNFSIKVYDKTAQLLDEGMIPLTDENCCRVEYKILRSSEVIRLLGSNNLIYVLESLDELSELYREYINKYIIKPSEKLSNEIEKQITKKLKGGEKPAEVFRDLMYDKAIGEPVSMIDVAIFEKAMRKYYTKNKKRNVARDIKTQLNTLSEKQLDKLSNNMYQVELLADRIAK